ncbi:hypothetical protein LXL04_002617 [Taraxacum kok-saghyz]
MKGQGGTEEDWQEVRRRRTQKNHNRYPERTSLSLYVSNIPVGFRKGDLWKTFKPLGKVVDVFIPDKMNKEGSFFWFIKFEGINDPQGFESSLPELKTYMRQHPESKPSQFSQEAPPPPTPDHPQTKTPTAQPPQSFHARHRDHRSYAGVVSGTKATVPIEIPMKPVPGLANWYSCSQNLFGIADSLEQLRELPKITEIVGGPRNNVYYTGGLGVSMRFSEPEDAKKFLEDEKTWSRWFKELRYGSGEIGDFKILAWIKVVGLPVTLESMDNLESIGNTLGRTLEVGELTWNKFDMSHNRLCVLTSTRKLINEERIVTLNNKKYTIGVSEVEVFWNPFKLMKGNPMDVRIIVEDYADLEDDDGKCDATTSEEEVEETDNGDHVSQLEEEMEEGEFRQEKTSPEKMEVPEMRTVDGNTPKVNARDANFETQRFPMPFPAVTVTNPGPHGAPPVQFHGSESPTVTSA